mgnify:CR=1 FL=1
MVETGTFEITNRLGIHARAAAKLVETANINAREEAERAVTNDEKTSKTLEWL